MTPEQFDEHNASTIKSMGASSEFSDLTQLWFQKASQLEYSYHFKWLGLPIIQFPQDVMAIQEIVWDVKPDLIIETGVARGGSLILYASLLELMGNDGQVMGIDIDIRQHNRELIESHPMSKRIELLQGSSVDADIVSEVYKRAATAERVLLVLDSNHTHEHALAEMQCYSDLVQAGSYMIVLDTVIEDMPAEFSNDRPWGPGDNPKTAVHEFLKTTDRFVIDHAVQDKLQITVGPDGFLKCLKDVQQREVA
jgi:cephalosporin hydroxylase